MINFFDSAYNDTAPLHQKAFVLESIGHYGGFSIADLGPLEDVKKKIKINLGSQQKRFDGLLLLNSLSDSCPGETFQQNAVSWVQMILKVLQNSGEACGSRRLALQILKKLIKQFCTFPHLRREAASSLLPSILDILLESSVDDEWIVQAADCLSACIKYFPTSCTQKQDKIEEFLILLLDKWELKEFEPLANCFAFLPTCGGSDENSTFHQRWTVQFKQFLNILNAILDFLYDGVENGCNDLKICSSKPLPPFPEEPFAAVLKLVYRFKAFGLCLSKMLVSASSGTVVVPIDTLLMVLRRTLSVTPSKMENNPLIYSVLPSMYLSTLTILESFILSCDKHLISVCQLVSKLLTQVIKNNFLQPINSLDSLNLVRCAAYQVLQLYTERFKLFSVAKENKEALVSAMIQDMKPYEPKVVTSKTPGSMQCNHDITDCENGGYTSNSRTSTEALKALKVFVESGNLEHKMLEEVYISVVNTILEIQQRPLDLPVPYSNENYRVALYDLLHSISRNLSLQNIKCLPTTISLVTNGLDDLSKHVTFKCEEILDVINNMLHTAKQKIVLPSAKEECEEEKLNAVYSEQTLSQVTNRNVVVYPVGHHIINNEHSTAITSESSAHVQVVNGILSVQETSASQNLDSSKSFQSELSREGPSTLDNAEGNGEPSFYTNSIVYSPREQEVEEDEMDVEEEEEDEEEEEEEDEEDEECRESRVNNHNGVTSEEDITDEEEEVSSSKRPASPDVQANGPPLKKIVSNDVEEHSQPDVHSMLEDFIPASPDRKS